MSIKPAKITPTVYIVDDDKQQLDLVSEMLAAVDYEIKTYSSGLEFLQESDISEIGCLLLDNQMPDVSGLDVQLELNQRKCEIPVLFISGGSIYGDVVIAVREGAFGFLQKPVSISELIKEVKDAVDESIVRQQARLARSTYTGLLDSLTPREQQVYSLIIAGHTNKVISAELIISLGTVEFHRANIMKKLEVTSLAELMAIAQQSK